MTTGRTLYIVNPAAGAGRAGAAWAECERRLRPGVATECVVTTRPGEALELARESAGTSERLVAVGGDGTATEVASGILAARPPHPTLGIIPVGTGNDIARALGLHSPWQAIEALNQGAIRAVDVIAVQCQLAGRPVLRHALGFAAVGITGELLRQTTPRIKRHCGQKAAYYLGLVLALWRYRSPRMTLTCDGRAHRGQFLLACASNAETFGGGMKISPGARIDDGRLNINLIEAVGRWEVLRQLHLLRSARHVTHPRVRYQTATGLEIECTPPVDVAIDGDLVGQTPARFQVQPRALAVVSMAAG